jgi:hypothetical protein
VDENRPSADMTNPISNHLLVKLLTQNNCRINSRYIRRSLSSFVFMLRLLLEKGWIVNSGDGIVSGGDVEDSLRVRVEGQSHDVASDSSKLPRRAINLFQRFERSHQTTTPDAAIMTTIIEGHAPGMAMATNKRRYILNP